MSLPGCRLFRLLSSVLLLAAPIAAGTDDSYRIFPRDVITIVVFGEADLSTQLRVSGNGTITPPLLGESTIAGLTLGEASRRLEEAYREADILLRPQITLQIAEYSKKEVSVLGQISRQGRVELPPETTSLSIVEVISAAGGFTRIARSDNVRITRRDPSAERDTLFFVNVDALIAGNANAVPFDVLPGDVIFVPERLF